MSGHHPVDDPFVRCAAGSSLEGECFTFPEVTLADRQVVQVEPLATERGVREPPVATRVGYAHRLLSGDVEGRGVSRLEALVELTEER